MSQQSNLFPKGIPYIIGNEAAERYSFYGMKAILVIFLTNFIMNASGEIDTLDGTDAKFWLHIFIFATYGISIFGAFLSDILWGKFKTIMVLSVVYCLGHFILALFETHYGFLVGCTLIAIGAGGIKPCVSAHVGDQFDKTNQHLLEKMYNWFYLSINGGAVIAYLTAEPILRNEFLIEKGLNAALAFGLPGVLMVIATIVFWLGRNKYISVKPAGWKLYQKELFSKKGLNLLLKLTPVFLFLTIFWSLFDQTGSAWVLQADSDLMNKTINLYFFTFDFYPSQVGFFNPLLVVILIPVFTAFLYPWLRTKVNLNYVNKMAIGMLLTSLSFALISWVQGRMDNDIEMNIGWQLLAFFILTSGEIFVSISSLEFSYTQAPNSLKSFMLSLWLMTTALGNGFAALINFLIKKPDGTLLLEGAAYFWFFTILMFLAAILFYFINRNYKEIYYIQDGEELV